MILQEGNWAFILEYEYPEEDMDELIELGKLFQEHSRREDGCMVYQVHFIEPFKNRVLIYQAFKDEDSLNKHIESEHFMEIGLRKIAPKIISKKITRLHPLISNSNL